jgi:hypothetical protein
MFLIPYMITASSQLESYIISALARVHTNDLNTQIGPNTIRMPPDRIVIEQDLPSIAFTDTVNIRPRIVAIGICTPTVTLIAFLIHWWESCMAVAFM